MKLLRCAFITLTAAGLYTYPAFCDTPDSGRLAAARQWRSIDGQRPLGFEENRGQAASGVRFVSQGFDHSVALTGASVRMTLGKSARPIEMRLVGANAAAKAEGLDALPFRSSYLIGDDASRWLMGVPNFRQAHFAGVWRGVDVVYYGNQRRLEYDFKVAPNADPSRIRLAFAGADSLTLAANGDLEVKAGDATFLQKKPFIYQTIDGTRREIAGGYVVRGRQVSFRLGAYDHTRELVIDPTFVLSVPAIFTGTAGNAASANSIAVDAAGNLFVTGQTRATGTPAQVLGYIVELNRTGGGGGAIIFGGQDGPTNPTAIAMDSTGALYVTGSTQSTHLPASPAAHAAFQAALADAAGDAFLLKVPSIGSAPAYSTYFGGHSADAARAIAVDAAGKAYIGGITASGDFPASLGNAFSATGNAAFVAVFDPSQSGPATRVWARLVGGTGTDNANGIGVDAAGNVYVAGSTSSTNFAPTPGVGNGFRQTKTAATDGFLLVLNSAGTGAVYFSYYPGGQANALALTDPADVYLAGTVPVGSSVVARNALQAAPQGGMDAFVAKFDTTTTGDASLRYSSVLGGAGDDQGFGVAADTLGDAYVVGQTSSANLPTTFGAVATTLSGSADAFFIKVNTNRSGAASLVYGTYLGGGGSDGALSVNLDAFNNAFFSGNQSSTNFPVPPGINPVTTSGTNGFAAGILSGAELQIYRNGFWYTDYNGNRGFDQGDIIINFGVQGDIPIHGDWNNTKSSKIGIYRNGFWFVDLNNNFNWDGTSGGDAIFNFGVQGDVPVVSDWDNTGRMRIGIYRNGFWFVDLNGNNAWDNTVGGDTIYNFGVTGDIPIVSDWDGTGRLRLGVYRNGLWFVDLNGNNAWDGTAGGDAIFNFGVAGDIPVVGDWDGTGRLRIGIYRNGAWFVDWNGNNQWDGTGPGGDKIFTFGVQGDNPVPSR